MKNSRSGTKGENIFKPDAWLLELVFSGGEKVDFDRKDKVIIVGANNSGKSTTLRDILGMAKNPSKDSKVVKGLKIGKEGTSEDLRFYLDAHGALDTSGNIRTINRWSLNAAYIDYWKQPGLTQQLSDGYIRLVTAEARLEITKTKKNISATEQKSAPQHVLYDNTDLMSRISGIFEKAFKEELLIDFRGGSEIPIHVGRISANASCVDRVSNEYVDKVRANPKLDMQGDGMRAYAGIIFELIADPLSISLLDEPEAFLHPPQMRRLGEVLAKEVAGQLIVATHSGDILRGFLQGALGEVRVLRISRKGNQNHVFEAQPSTVKLLWSEPILRFSNAIDALFHEQCIICEDDSDCRLYEATMAYCLEQLGHPIPDTLFIPSGGKDAVRKIAPVLRGLGIPTKCILDSDAISDEAQLRLTVEAFGGVWSDLAEVWNRISKALEEDHLQKSSAEIKADLQEYINKTSDDEISMRQIASITKKKSKWHRLKESGEAGLPKGDTVINYRLLLDRLTSLGIFVVPVGEVEGFCPEIGGHGPKFVTSVLDKIELSSDKLSSLRDFVANVCEREL